MIETLPRPQYTAVVASWIDEKVALYHTLGQMEHSVVVELWATATPYLSPVE